MPRFWMTAGAAGTLAFLAIQFIRPAISNPPVTADLEAPPDVKKILRKACYDCHSNETHLAWFDQIVPAYWLVASDVKRGRSRLNFSEISKLTVGQQTGALYEAVNQVQLGAMPLANYTRLHRAAQMTPAQIDVLRNYLRPTANGTAKPGDLAADRAQYEQWLRDGHSRHAVQPAPNGIQFPYGYQNWKAISATDRFDNGTLRVILGNDTAVKAVAEGHTNPWPGGSTLAKVAWFARADGQGQIRSGAFFQVEFMIRDRQKYAATKGWGWARWRGAGLAPYGKDSGFATECVGCHTPLRDNDYVFTVPPPQVQSNLAQANVITSLVQQSSATMSTLYGNDAAVLYVRSNSQLDYPPGTELSLVTWTQQEDPHWFGANIPKQAKSVELLHVDVLPNKQRSYSYELYEGSPLARTATSVGRPAASRAAFLLSLRAAVMP